MDVDPGIGGEPGIHVRVLVGGVIVQHQVQLAVGVGPRDVLEEGQGLLVRVPVIAHPGDPPGRDLQRREQCGGAVPDVVVGALLGVAGLHRQSLLTPVQRLNLALLVAADTSFPRHWVYDSDGRLSQKAAVTDWADWTAQQSWTMTPWGGNDSPAVISAAETGLERLIATAIMRDHPRSQIRQLSKGTVLMQQGEAGAELYLLLDGVLSVSVNGNDLAELGPGAIVGERAILEGGKRTSTLTAVTPVRVAVAPSSAIDMTALAQLSHRHHREDDLGRTDQ